jgi:hypothetical protein
MTMLDDWAQAFLETGDCGDGGLVGMPEGYGCVRWAMLENLLQAKGMTVHRVRVLVELARLMEEGSNQVKLTFEMLAQRLGVSKGTVFRAVRFLEEAGALKRLSKENANSRWRVNPLLCCALLPDTEVVRYEY